MSDIKFHIFIVPDGNRRWAKLNNLAPHQGHRAGYKTLKTVLGYIWNHDVTHFTFWALSLDNIKKRTPKEIEYLFKTLATGAEELKNSEEFRKKNIQFRLAGNFKDYLPLKTISRFREIENETQNNIGPVFTILLAYDGEKELCDAIETICQNPDKTARSVKELLSKNLQTGFLPPVDLMIRTGGEPHLSAGALMWQMQNAHLYFTKTLWPSFLSKELGIAINEFKKRERRFGA